MRQLSAIAFLFAFASTALIAQRPQLTPEQQAEAAKRREAEMAA